MQYHIKRIGQAAVTMLSGMFITYALIRLMPGGPLQALIAREAERMRRQGGSVNQQELARIAERQTGINPDAGIIQGYIGYVQDIVFNQDFGRSISFSEPVFEVLFRAMPWSMFISGYGLLLGFSTLVIIGTYMAWNEGTRKDSGLTVFVLLMNSIPYYVGAVFLLTVLGYSWEIFPTGGRYPNSVEPGFSLPFMIGVLQHAALPIMSSYIVGFGGGVGGGALGMRANSVRIMGSEYLRSARLRGLGTNRVLTRYLGRNAILPMYTALMIGIAALFSSNVILEQIFQYPGVGWYLLDALFEQDFPLLMGSFLFLGGLTLIGALFADFTYGLIDPRAGSGQTRESF